MRSFSHITPRYIVDRLGVIFYEKTHPDHPWLTRTANTVLNSWLKKTDVGLEFGSGRSTVWFAKRVGKLTSVEHHDQWTVKVREMLVTNKLTNVDHQLHVMDRPEDNAADASYVKAIDQFADNSLDFCLDDGVYRNYCALHVLDKLRPGGLLVVDNVNWYLPSNTRSPASRSLKDGPVDGVWKEVEQKIANWRRIWTSSGQTDTAIFIKPC